MGKINWEKFDMKKLNAIAKGLYNNPKSTEWRAEYSDLTREEKEAVKRIIGMNETGVGENPNREELQNALNE